MYGSIQVQNAPAASIVKANKTPENPVRKPSRISTVSSAGLVSWPSSTSSFSMARHRKHIAPGAISTVASTQHLTDPTVQSQACEDKDSSRVNAVVNSRLTEDLTDQTAASMPAMHTHDHAKAPGIRPGEILPGRDACPSMHATGIVTLSSLLSLNASGSLQLTNASEISSRFEHTLNLNGLNSSMNLTGRFLTQQTDGVSKPAGMDMPSVGEGP